MGEFCSSARLLLQVTNQEPAMLASLFILLILIPIAFLPVVLNGFFSPDDLNEMGIVDDQSL